MKTLFGLICRIGFFALRVILFIFLLLIAIINTNPVDFHWFIGQSFQIPLSFLLFGSFLLGLMVCVLVLSSRKKS
jgi:uncharacterized integral membrane protein